PSARHETTPGTRSRSLRRGVRLASVVGDAGPRGDLVSVHGRPLATLLRFAGRAASPAAPRAPAGAAARTRPLLPVGGPLASVVVVQVDLVRDAVEPERDRVRSVRSVDIVHEENLGFAGHYDLR